VIEKLVRIAVGAPFVVLALALALLGLGIYCYGVLDVEAYPNPVPPLVEVITQPEGLGAEEVERTITIPLEIGLSGMPGLSEVRSQSLFGLSDIKCYFDWGTDYTAARQETINRLGFVTLPNGAAAGISPWNAIGEILRYTVDGDRFSLQERKTLQDWVLVRQLRQADGVVGVSSFGGDTRQYHIEVDPMRLRGLGVSLSDMENAVQNANENVSGRRITIGEQSYDVRGVGLLRNVHDIEDVVIRASEGVPTRVREIAATSIGAAPRLGQVGRDDDNDVVQGVVLMRYGAETPSTLAAVQEKLRQIEKERLLPPGVHVNPVYNRGDLVHLTMHTVIENVAMGIFLVTLVLIVFINNLRAALITSLTIPLALMAAFCGLVFTDTSANLISLGAIDFGIVADSTVIMVENVFRHLGSRGSGTIQERVLSAAREVARPMTISTVIIGVSFLPLFTLTGVAGVIFAPMARTYAYAIGGALLLAVTLTPVMITKLVRPDTEEREGVVMRTLHRLYTPVVDAALRRPKRALVALSIPVFASAALSRCSARSSCPSSKRATCGSAAPCPCPSRSKSPRPTCGACGASCGAARRTHRSLATPPTAGIPR